MDLFDITYTDVRNLKSNSDTF